MRDIGKCGVLGSSGFLGGHLMDLLKTYNIPSVGGSRRASIESELVDARNCNALERWIKENGITHVINLAAECGGIGLNQSSAADLWRATTEINSAILHTCHKCNVEKLTMVGTVCSYAKHAPVPFKENDLMCHGFPEETNAAYGVAKLNGYFGCLAYREQYDLNAIFLLPVNLYGPRDNFDLHTSHVIPALIRKCIEARDSGDTVKCWGTGAATREFLYVEDAARGILQATHDYNKPLPVNIGIGHEISIKDLVGKIANLTNYQDRIEWDASKPDGQPRRMLDVSRAEEEFNFTARVNIDEGLRRTVQWYEKERVCV